MWPLLWTAILALIQADLAVAGPSIAPLPPSSAGPTSSAEEEILWKKGMKAYDEQRFPDAITPLQRLVDRYPGSSRYLRAHLLLGHAYLATGAPESAQAPLQYFISASPPGSDAMEARLDLAQADLKTGKPVESYLSAQEAQRLAASSRELANHLPKALIAEARALIGMNRDAKAAEAVTGAEAQVTSATPIAVQGSLGEVSLELKLRECARFPHPKTLPEPEAIDQLDRRGTCLSEALIVFRSALKAHDDASSRQAAEKTVEALQSYRVACEKPPLPTDSKKLSASQKKSYVNELRARLLRDFHSKLEQMRPLLQRWEPDPYVASVLKGLEKL